MDEEALAQAASSVGEQKRRTWAGTPRRSKGTRKPSPESPNSERLLNRKAIKTRVRSPRWVKSVLVLVLVAAVAISATGVYLLRDYIWGARADARAAAQAVRDGDLGALSDVLSANRGQRDFAYFFATTVTPRELGDALGAIASGNTEHPLNPRVDADEYEITLTDLAGSLALASHGTGDRKLPKTWTAAFISATTDLKFSPSAEKQGVESGLTVKERTIQDAANRTNLLLLLARGYWSTDFLKSVTEQFHDFAKSEGRDAWPAVDASSGGDFAPAPNGAFLADGMLALTAALATNSEASEWAFTEFLPGQRAIEGTDHEVGKFTHFLLFEYQSTGDTERKHGYGVVLAALSSAATSEQIAERTAENPKLIQIVKSSEGPLHDAQVIEALALDVQKVQGAECSGDPRTWGNCTAKFVQAIWNWLKQWLHVILDVLALATFLPFPFGAIGVAAAAVNATWYALEGDFASAGLSLATAVPGVAFGKVAQWASKSGKLAAGSEATLQSAKQASVVASVAKQWRPIPAWKDCALASTSGGIVVKYGSNWNRAQKRAADEKAKALNRAAADGQLAKSKSNRSSESASSIYRKQTGKDVPRGSDVDHTIELQLGGKDDVSNMRPLDKTVNSSFGAQISRQLAPLAMGTPVPAVAICR